MKRKVIIGIFPLIVFIAYLFGNYLPIEAIRPIITDKTLSKGEYNSFISSLISSIITFFTLLIALFKEDLRELWKRPILKFELPENHTIEDLDSSLDSESEIETIIAKRYLSSIQIINSGNLPALDCEMYLDSLEFTPNDSSIKQNIFCPSSSLEWNGTESKIVVIPSGGKKIIDIIMVTAPEKYSTPDSEKTNNKSQLHIGLIPFENYECKGIWNAKFILFAKNHKPVNLDIEVKWNGVWKGRLTDFDKLFQIKLVK